MRPWSFQDGHECFRSLRRDRPSITSRVDRWRPDGPRKICHFCPIQDHDRTPSDPRGRNSVYPQYTRSLRPNTPEVRHPVWCQKSIEENRRGIGVFVRVEEGLYERYGGRTRRSVGREKATRAGALPLAFQFLAAWLGVWVARHQMGQIEYLRTLQREGNSGVDDGPVPPLLTSS